MMLYDFIIGNDASSTIEPELSKWLDTNAHSGNTENARACKEETTRLQVDLPITDTVLSLSIPKPSQPTNKNTRRIGINFK